MAIKVYTQGETGDEFKSGLELSVLEGHLYVYDGRNKVIAIYAPDQWERAVHGTDKED